MATLVRKTIADAGTAFTLAAASAAGDAALFDNKAQLLVLNGSGSSITVTMISEFVDQLGQTAADNVVTVAASEYALIPFKQVYKDATTKLVSWTYSSETTVSVAVV